MQYMEAVMLAKVLYLVVLLAGAIFLGSTIDSTGWAMLAGGMWGVVFALAFSRRAFKREEN